MPSPSDAFPLPKADLPVSVEVAGRTSGIPLHNRYGSIAVTRGIRVEVHPGFLKEHAVAPHERDDAGFLEGSVGAVEEESRTEFVFAYRVRITNESDTPVKLLSRYWLIVDADGDRHEVAGPGVVGRQPELQPGQSHEYASFCPLATPWGTMEGYFVMCPGGDREKTFKAAVGRFYLVAAKG